MRHLSCGATSTRPRGASPVAARATACPTRAGNLRAKRSSAPTRPRGAHAALLPGRAGACRDRVPRRRARVPRRPDGPPPPSRHPACATSTCRRIPAAPRVRCLQRAPRRRRASASLQQHRIGAHAGERAQRQRLAHNHRVATRRASASRPAPPARWSVAPARPPGQHRAAATADEFRDRRRVRGNEPAVEHDDHVELLELESRPVKLARRPCVTSTPGATASRADTVHPCSSSAAITNFASHPARPAPARATGACRAPRPPAGYALLVR